MNEITYIFITGILGLVFGSFASVVSYRYVHEVSFFLPLRCPNCCHRLGIKDLIPLFSYLFSKGKCRYCATHINPRYPLIEITTSIAFLVVALNHHRGMESYLLCLLAVALIIMSVTDLEDYMIPDSIQILIGVIGIVYGYINGYSLLQIVLMPVLSLAISLLLKYGYNFFTKQDGLEWGDVKFFLVSGLFLTTNTLPLFYFLSATGGIFISIIWNFLGKGKVFPFGPALALALYICLVFKI